LLFACWLAALLAFGVAARSCAASLYIACVAVSHAGMQIATWDDYAAILLTFVLTALPLGNGLSLPWRADRAARLPGSSTTVLLVLVCGLYATRALGLLAPDVAHAQLAVNGLALVPVALILPSSAAQKLGVTVQVLSHAYLMAHGDFFLLHGALACTACLFWGEPAPAKSAQGPVWDVGAVALTSVLTFAVFGVALQLVGFNAGALRAAAMLRHVGLLPPAISAGG
jgi:hypothetical protein